MNRPVCQIRGLLLWPLLVLPFSSAADTILIGGGKLEMGSEAGGPDERPIVTRDVAPFHLDRSPVTVGEFAEFVKSSGHVTTAEELGDSGVFHMETGRWSLVPGADFRHPLGPDGGLAALDHPVTHVSWFDAAAYCEAADGRLPTEAEFEFAAKAGSDDGNPVYAFGDALKRDGEFLVNVYTGFFPVRNTAEDGYTYTAPVGKTGITPLGLTDMAGNVWEWSADWYLPYGDRVAGVEATEKAQRGGSFLCDKDYCRGYRTSARSHSTPDSSLIHVGFRCAYDADA